MIILVFFVLVAFSTFLFQKIEKRLFPNKTSLLSFAKQALLKTKESSEDFNDLKEDKQPTQDSISTNPVIKEKIESITKLENETKELSIEAEKYNNPSEYAKHSKLRRKIIANERKIEEEKLILKKLQEVEAMQPATQSIPQKEIQAQVSLFEEQTSTTPKQPENNSSDNAQLDSGKKERNLKLAFNIMRYAFPLILLFVFRKVACPIYMDSSLLYPLDWILGKAESPFIFNLSFSVGYLTICYAVINRLKNVFSVL